MSNMFTPSEFAGLIDHGHRTATRVVLPGEKAMEIHWPFSIIGMNIQGTQRFTTDPCEFVLAAFDDNGEERWTCTASFERANNLPSALFGTKLADPMIVSMFGFYWNPSDFPRLDHGDDDQFTTDLMMLRMASELWSI